MISKKILLQFRDVHFNPFPVYPDADSENTSLEEDGYSEPDGSLDNFLVRLYSRSTAQQTVPINEKWSTASQTQFSHVRASFSKKVLRVSKDFGVADVVAVVAPTHIAVPRQALVRTQPNQQSSSSSSSKGYRQRQLQQEDGPAVDSYAFIDTPPARVTVVSVTQRPVNKRGNYSRPTNHHSTSARRSSVPAATNTNTMTGTTALTATHVGNRPASSQPQEKKRVGTAKKHIEPIPRHHKDTIRKPAWH